MFATVFSIRRYNKGQFAIAVDIVIGKIVVLVVIGVERVISVDRVQQHLVHGTAYVTDSPSVANQRQAAGRDAGQVDDAAVAPSIKRCRSDAASWVTSTKCCRQRLADFDIGQLIESLDLRFGLLCIANFLGQLCRLRLR